MIRLLALVLTLLVAAPLSAQEAPDRSATGGAQTLADIMARQAAQDVDDQARRENLGDPCNAAAMSDDLGALGGLSDAENWRAIRYGVADVTTVNTGPAADVLVQSSGMTWHAFRAGPMSTYGGWLLLGTIVALVVFYLLRGRIAVDAGLLGRTVLRFKFIERFAHWMLAGSFIVLGITGLFVKYGRDFIVPTFGHEANATLLLASKFIHNNVSWAFMLALGMIFVMWVWHNIPNRTDITWFAQAGGIIGSNHPPAKKFNAGQKIIFWSCILLGGSISISGLSLLFPFEMPLFAKTFGVLNATGLPEWVGLGFLPETMSPQQEMQLAQTWHAIVSFILMAIIIAHIYIGSVGMEGAASAMTTGEVDEAWAHQHHSLWLEEVKEQRKRDAAAMPGE